MRTLIMLLAVLTVGAGPATAEVPQLLSYQGKLLDGSGTPVPDGTWPMMFRFYDDCEAGQLLLEDSHDAVATSDGIYGVLLGGGTLTPGVEPDLVSVFANHDVVCLGVTVGADVEMTPRQQIVSSGFALRSAFSDDVAGASTLVHYDEDVTWSGTHQFDGTVGFADGKSLYWPVVTGNPPPDAGFRLTKFNSAPPGQTLHPNGENDEQWMICYNCEEGSTFRQDLTQHAWNQKIESSYFDGAIESLENNWNYTAPSGLKWRPFAFRLIIDGTCSNDASYCVDDADCGAGNTCDGANRAEFQWNTRSGNTRADFELIRSTGRVRFNRGLEGYITHEGQTGGTASLWGFQLFTDIDTENTSSGPTIFGLTLQNDFSGETPDAQVVDQIGLRSRNVFSGTTTGRDVTAQMIAVDGWSSLTQTGAGASVDRVFGFRYKFEPTGQNLTVGESNGLRIDTPQPLAASAPIDVQRHHGVRVLDQRGMGSIEGGAITVSAQTTSPDPERGNVNLQGGGWEDGHLTIEQGHVWMDKTDRVLRYKDGAPTGEGDGTPLHAPPGTNTSWGGVYWGDPSSGDHDTGTEVCALAGLTCLETYDLGSASALNCTSASHATPKFLALCY